MITHRAVTAPADRRPEALIPEPPTTEEISVEMRTARVPPHMVVPPAGTCELGCASRLHVCDAADGAR